MTSVTNSVMTVTILLDSDNHFYSSVIGAIPVYFAAIFIVFDTICFVVYTDSTVNIANIVVSSMHAAINTVSKCTKLYSRAK